MGNVTTDFVQDKFTARLKELRGEKSLQEISEAIGISRVSLGYYETGNRKPDIEILYKIAKFYGVSADYLIGISDVRTPDIDIQSISSKTGLSEKAIEKVYHFNRHAEHYIEPLNILLKSPNFESALLHISKYMEEVQIVEILQNQRRERRNEVFSAEPDCILDDGQPVYNWPYNDNLDKNYKAKEKDMILQEYMIDKAFKYIIREMERLAKEKVHNTD